MRPLRALRAARDGALRLLVAVGRLGLAHRVVVRLVLAALVAVIVELRHPSVFAVFVMIALLAEHALLGERVARHQLERRLHSLGRGLEAEADRLGLALQIEKGLRRRAQRRLLAIVRARARRSAPGPAGKPASPSPATGVPAVPEAQARARMPIVGFRGRETPR